MCEVSSRGPSKADAPTGHAAGVEYHDRVLAVLRDSPYVSEVFGKLNQVTSSDYY